MPTPLPRSTPLEQDVDPAGVLAFLDALEARPDVEMHSLIVVRHGHVVVEGGWAPYMPERPQLLHSISKSFTAAALGFAQTEGLLDLDETVVSCFPELDAEVTDPRSRSMTLRHLAAMASGHGREMLDEARKRDPEDLVRGFLLIPPDEEPGSVFAYSQPCSYALAAVIQRRSGTSLTDYLRPRLLDPMGIGEVGWQTGPTGLELGFTGLFAGTEDVAKLGLLHLQGGRWDDTQLLTREWVATATSKHVDTDGAGSGPDWWQGYGYQFWRGRHGYRGDGAYGQFCLVLPEQDTVVATTALTEEMQAVLDACWTHLLPALGRPAAGPDAQRDLATRLRSLRLPEGPGGPPSDVRAHWPGQELQPAEPRADGRSFDGLRALRVEQDGTRIVVTLVEDDDELRVEVGTGEWRVSSPISGRGAETPVAASGGWLDDDTLAVRIAFVATPHRMDLTCSLPAGTAEAVWRHVPLHRDRLRFLHCPAATVLLARADNPASELGGGQRCGCGHEDLPRP